MSDIFVLTGQEEEYDPYEWYDMPEFVQEEKEAYAVFKVRIRNEEDLRAFAKLVEQPSISTKTQAIWYPALDRNENTLLRYIDDED